MAALGSAGYYAAYGIIIFRTVRADFSIGDLTFLAGSFARLRSLLEGMLTRFSQIAERALYLKDRFELFEIRPVIAAPENPRPVPDPIHEGFRFEGVSFRYPSTDRLVLRDVTFTLKAGEKLALVGENGAGKTAVLISHRFFTMRMVDRILVLEDGKLLEEGSHEELLSVGAAGGRFQISTWAARALLVLTLAEGARPRELRSRTYRFAVQRY